MNGFCEQTKTAIVKLMKDFRAQKIHTSMTDTIQTESAALYEDHKSRVINEDHLRAKKVDVDLMIKCVSNKRLFFGDIVFSFLQCHANAISQEILEHLEMLASLASLTFIFGIWS